MFYVQLQIDLEDLNSHFVAFRIWLKKQNTCSVISRHLQLGNDNLLDERIHCVLDLDMQVT